MAYNRNRLSKITAAMNTTVVFDYNVTGEPVSPRVTSLNCFNYVTSTDTMAQVMADDYFLDTPEEFGIGDWIYVQASNGSIILEILDLNVGVEQKFYPAAAAIPATVLVQPVLGQTVTQTTHITSAQLLAGLTYALTTAPAGDFKYMFLGASVTLDYNTTAYTTGITTLTVHYGAAGPACSSTIANTFLALTADSSAMIIPIAVAGTAEGTMNDALTMVAVGQPVVGNSPLTVDTTYVIVSSTI